MEIQAEARGHSFATLVAIDRVSTVWAVITGCCCFHRAAAASTATTRPRFEVTRVWRRATAASVRQYSHGRPRSRCMTTDSQIMTPDIQNRPWLFRLRLYSPARLRVCYGWDRLTVNRDARNSGRENERGFGGGQVIA